jgi:ATP-dependent Lon protease
MDDLISADIQKLESQLAAATIPAELRLKSEEMLARLTRQAAHGSYAADFEQTQHYLDWVTHLPWDTKTVDTLDLGHVKQILDSHHFGLEDLKERFLEYISVMILNQKKADSTFRAPILLLVGLVGTGKTTIAKSIAQALGRKFVRLPFGGMSSALDLRGQSRATPDSEPGQIIKGIRRAGSKNPIFLLDEIDRVSDSARGEIMGVLVELLDPEQNASFTDHYLDYPFDLSQVMFIATANNTTHISTAVMDRLEPVLMPSYTDEEKIKIAKDYILPVQLKNAALSPETIIFDEAVWPKIVRPLGFDAGIRTLERTIEGMIRKVSKLIVSGKGHQFTINEANLKQFLPTY